MALSSYIIYNFKDLPNQVSQLGILRGDGFTNAGWRWSIREKSLPYFSGIWPWNRSSWYLPMSSNKQLNVTKDCLLFFRVNSPVKFFDCTTVNLSKILRSLLIEFFVATTVE